MSRKGEILHKLSSDDRYHKFKKGWVYTYDEYGLISKRLIRAINFNPLYYQLTGDPNYKWKENEMFLRKKDCEQAMKEAGIEKKSLQQITIIKLEEECKRLFEENKRLERSLELMAQDYISFTDEVEITPLINYYYNEAEKG